MIPTLWRTHPNFFIIYFVTAVCLHLGLGVSQLIDSERYQNETFEMMFEVMPIEAWAILNLMAWALMTTGAYYRFDRWGRLGLGLGLFLCLARGLLVELGPSSGAGLFIWVTVAALHFSQLSEPPVNPLTEKR